MKTSALFYGTVPVAPFQAAINYLGGVCDNSSKPRQSSPRSGEITLAAISAGLLLDFAKRATKYHDTITANV